MASGNVTIYTGSFDGAASDIDIKHVPFRPRVIEFKTTNSRWGLKIEDEYEMESSKYVSSVAADLGVTINDDGFTVANGADINTAGQRTYFVCYDQ